jgi:hypothetical protein
MFIPKSNIKWRYTKKFIIVTRIYNQYTNQMLTNRKDIIPFVKHQKEHGNLSLNCI